jgi:hypothetical protein
MVVVRVVLSFKLQQRKKNKQNKQYGPTLLATNLHQYFTVIMYLRRLIQVHFDNNSSIHVSQSDRNALQWRTTKTQSLNIKRNKLLETHKRKDKTLIIQPGNQRNYTECATKMLPTTCTQRHFTWSSVCDDDTNVRILFSLEKLQTPWWWLYLSRKGDKTGTAGRH